MERSRPPTDPYIVTEDPRIGWHWSILKTYQADGSKPYARAFCRVRGDEDELDDGYVSEIGRVIIDFDRDTFDTPQDAGLALFGTSLPFLVDLGPLVE